MNKKVVGWKVWTVEYNPPLLVSPVAKTVWKNKHLTFACEVGHTKPNRWCSCGIWVTNKLDRAEEQYGKIPFPEWSVLVPFQAGEILGLHSWIINSWIVALPFFLAQAVLILYSTRLVQMKWFKNTESISGALVMDGEMLNDNWKGFKAEKGSIICLVRQKGMSRYGANRLAQKYEVPLFSWWQKHQIAKYIEGELG